MDDNSKILADKRLLKEIEIELGDVEIPLTRRIKNIERLCGITGREREEEIDHGTREKPNFAPAKGIPHWKKLHTLLWKNRGELDALYDSLINIAAATLALYPAHITLRTKSFPPEKPFRLVLWFNFEIGKVLHLKYPLKQDLPLPGYGDSEKEILSGFYFQPFTAMWRSELFDKSHSYLSFLDTKRFFQSGERISDSDIAVQKILDKIYKILEKEKSKKLPHGTALSYTVKPRPVNPLPLRIVEEFRILTESVRNTWFSELSDLGKKEVVRDILTGVDMKTIQQLNPFAKFMVRELRNGTSREVATPTGVPALLEVLHAQRNRGVIYKFEDDPDALYIHDGNELLNFSRKLEIIRGDDRLKPLARAALNLALRDMMKQSNSSVVVRISDVLNKTKIRIAPSSIDPDLSRAITKSKKLIGVQLNAISVSKYKTTKQGDEWYPELRVSSTHALIFISEIK